MTITNNSGITLINTLINGLAGNVTLVAGANVTLTPSGNNITIASTGGGGGGAVDSVNGQTGVVVLDTGDIATVTNKNYVTDAQLTVLGNTSGTNTGDQTSIVGITGTKAQFDTALTDGNFLYVGDVTQYTDEMAQDAVGTILVDSSEIDFTYNDATPSITASIVAGSIDESKLDTSVNASLDLADSAAQASFRTIAISGQSDVVADSATDTLTFVAGTNITLTTDAATDTITITASGGGGGAPTGAEYVVLSTNGSLTHERVLTAGTGISISDAGAGSTVTVASTITQYTDEMAQDAIGAMINSSLTYTDGTPLLALTSRTINGVAYDGTANITVAAAAGTLTGTTLAAGVTASSLTSVGTLVNLTVTNPISGSVTGSSASTTGNAATATALQTARTIGGVSFNGTANIVPQTIQSINEATDTTCFPLFITASGTQSLQPMNNTAFTFNSATGALGATSFSGAGTGLTGTAASLTAGTVTTNANLTGEVTSVGNATTVTNAAVIGKVITGYTSGAGTVAATDTILQAIQKLNGNDANRQPLDATLTALAAYNTNGILTQTAADTFVGRTLTGTASQITVTNGDGVSGNPTLSLPATINVNTSGNAATVTTNANLTGDVTSVGNATSIASGVIVNADVNASAGILLSKTNISLTTTGTSGASTLNTTTGVLNIPQYSGGSASNSFSTIAVSGQSDVVADSSTDTLTLVAGSGMVITTNAGTDTITLATTGGGGTPTAITVANEATDTTCFPLFVTAATGDLGPKTNTGLTYNSATNAFGMTGKLSDILTDTTTTSVLFQDLAGVTYSELNWAPAADTGGVRFAQLGYAKHTSATSITGAGHMGGVLGYATKTNATGTDAFLVGVEGRVGANEGTVTVAAALVGTFDTNTENNGSITIGIGLYIPNQADSGHIAVPLAIYNEWANAPIRTLGAVQAASYADQTGANSFTAPEVATLGKSYALAANLTTYGY